MATKDSALETKFFVCFKYSTLAGLKWECRLLRSEEEATSFAKLGVVNRIPPTQPLVVSHFTGEHPIEGKVVPVPSTQTLNSSLRFACFKLKHFGFGQDVGWVDGTQKE